jgi:PAS domain S-box-containing protein
LTLLKDYNQISFRSEAIAQEKGNESKVNRKDTRYLSFMPIPALVLIILALYFIIKPSLFYEPSWLLPITNTVFVTVVFLIVAYIATRNYKATGRIQILLLGCGVLAFGIGGVIAGFVRSVPGAGANLNVTIYNTGALIGAVFHFAAAIILLAGISPEVGSKRKEAGLVLSYVGVAIFMALFTMASLRGMIPPFFIQGVGPTALRQWVLGSADILFGFSFLIFMRSYLRNGEIFLFWYSSALALTCVSLTAFLIESAVGSPIGWVGRFSQYLGGIYFLIAVIMVIKSAQVRRTSFDDVLTASLSPVEEKFRALAEHSPDMIERFDREMKHIYVNRAGLRLYGKPAGSIIGKTIEEVGLAGPYVDLLKEGIQRVFETAQSKEVEHSISTENGTRFYQSHCVPEFGVDGAVANVLVVSHDLTERKQAEEALRTTLESIGDGFFACDADWRFVYVNALAERILGIHREEVLGKSHWEVFPLTLGTQLEGEYRRAAAGEIRDFENFYEPWGRWLHNRCFPRKGGGISVYFEDITERKRAEEALRQSEERLNLAEAIKAERQRLYDVLETLPVMICLLTPDYHVAFANRSFREKFGESGGRHCYEYCFERTGPCDFCETYKVLETGKPHHWEITVPDGTSIIDAHDFPFTDLDGSPLILEMDIDITERKQAEEALRKAHDQVQFFASQCLTAQERERKLIAQEIHDSMGASLAATKFKVETALKEMGDDNPQTRVALESVIPIIQETIEEARRIQMSLRPSMLDDIGILATINWVCRQFESTYLNIRIKREIDIEEHEVPDPVKIVIYRVLQEALHNIAKHSKADRVNLLLRKTDGAIELGVQDNGQGFDLGEAQSRIGTGRGLGLDSMRERAGLSGGSFSIESSKGAGTAIKATWPIEQLSA